MKVDKEATNTLPTNTLPNNIFATFALLSTTWLAQNNRTLIEMLCELKDSQEAISIKLGSNEVNGK